MSDIFEEYLAGMAAGGQNDDDLFASYLRRLAPPSPAGRGPAKTGGGPKAAEAAPPAAAAALPQPAAALPLPVQNGQVYDLAIQGGKLVLPEFGLFEGELYIQNGTIACVSAAGANLAARQCVNAGGRYVLPGILDPHIHLGLFHPLAEELTAETAAALIGGVTTAGWFVGADKAQMGAFEEVAEQVNAYSHINILPHFVINNEQQLCQIPRLIGEYGVRSFKVYMHGVPGLINSSDDAFILQVMQRLKASGEDCLLCVHSENHAIVEEATQRVMQKTGERATLADWAETHPAMAEEEAIARMAFFAQKLQQRVYIVHVSSRAGAEMLRKVKRGNPYIIGETTSPYLTTTMEDCDDFRGKMEPPLRAHADKEALWKALLDGTISTIGTDNVTVPDTLKAGDGKGMFGAMSGYAVLETHLPSLLTEGVMKRGLPLQQLVAKITMEPAKVFGLYPQKGSLMPGADADICLVDMEHWEEVNAKNLHSLSGYSIFESRKLTGFASMTIQGGHIVAADGELVDGPFGKLV